MSADFPIPNQPTTPDLHTPAPQSHVPSAQRSSFPAATVVIMAICVVVFLLQNLAGGSKNPNVLLDFGASFAPYFAHGQYWRAVMPMFLHIGLWHLAVNMYVLYVLGPLLERIYGYGRYTLIYVASGICSSLLTMYHGHNVAAGASGAIMGVAGALAAASYLHRDRLPHPVARVFRRGRFTVTVIIFVAITLVSGYLMPNIDNWGHIGGLAGGVALGALIPPPSLAPDAGAIGAGFEHQPSQSIVWIPIAVVALAMAATARHYRVAHEVSGLLEEAGRLRLAHQSQAALDRYTKAEQLDPQDERVHLELGEIHLAEHRAAEAVDEFQKALRIAPDSVPAQAGLADAYDASGDFARAESAYQALQRKRPNDPVVHESAAQLYTNHKLYPQAIDQYQQVLRLSPNDALAHNNLAWMYATADDPKFRNAAAALEHATKAVNLTASREPDLVDTLAEALYVNGKFADAVRVETKALQLAPDNKDFQEHMSRYRQAAGH